MTRDTILTVALVVCAFVTTSVVVYRQFIEPTPTSTAAPARAPEFVKDWRSLLDEGTRLGPRTAAVHLVEFGDFQCPFCSSFHTTVKALRQQYPTQVALTFIHYPLPMHSFALPAAKAVECAGEQGRFEAMHDRLFQRQSAFGIRAWNEFAVEAGVPDIATFVSCTERSSPVSRIVEGRRLGEALGIPGTPTVLINGWKLSSPPSVEELDALIKRVLAGQDLGF